MRRGPSHGTKDGYATTRGLRRTLQRLLEQHGASHRVMLRHAASRRATSYRPMCASSCPVAPRRGESGRADEAKTVHRRLVAKGSGLGCPFLSVCSRLALRSRFLRPVQEALSRVRAHLRTRPRLLTACGCCFERRRLVHLWRCSRFLRKAAFGCSPVHVHAHPWSCTRAFWATFLRYT